MNKGFTTCLVVLGVVQDVLGTVHNSPCKRTEEWSQYHLRCLNNGRIHIKRHVIEDGFKRLQFPALGCSINDAIYCGTDLLKNSTINLQNGVFVNAVKQCNGQIQCSLDKNYFAKAEKRVRDSCSASLNPDLQNAKFRQSIEYECIGESEIMDMCSTFGVNWSQPIYLETSGNGTARNCSCHITGSPSLVEILQIISVRVQILSHDSYILDHQNYPLGIYGMAIPISADSLTLTLVDVSNESLALIKIVGNVLVECNEKKTSSNLNNQSQLQTSNTHTSTGYTVSETFETTTYTSNKEDQISETQASTDKNIKSWTRSLYLVLTASILVVILLLMLSVIQRRKDRDLLLAILHRLNEKHPDMDYNQHSDTPETNHSQISDSDRNYQEISSHFFNHPNTTQLINPNYETEVKGKPSTAITVEKQDPTILISMAEKDDQSLPYGTDTNGVYELQQRF